MKFMFSFRAVSIRQRIKDAQTPPEILRRLKQQRIYNRRHYDKHKRGINETPEERSKRLQKHREYNRTYYQRTKHWRKQCNSISQLVNQFQEEPVLTRKQENDRDYYLKNKEKKLRQRKARYLMETPEQRENRAALSRAWHKRRSQNNQKVLEMMHTMQELEWYTNNTISHSESSPTGTTCHWK